MMYGAGLAVCALAATWPCGARGESAPAATAQPPAELTEKDDKAWSAEVSVDVLSDYVWRGMIANDNPVWQPAVTLAYDTGDWGALSANVWSTFDLTHKRGSSNNSRRAAGLQEIDYTLSYAIEWAGVGLETGYIWYTYPNNNGATDQDIFASVSYDNPIVTPALTVFWNYSDSCGNDPSALYCTFACSHTFELTEKFALTPSAGVGYGNHGWTDAGHELTDQTVGLSATYALCDYVSLGAQINYTWVPSHELRRSDWMGEGKDQLCWGGVNVTFSF